MTPLLWRTAWRDIGRYPWQTVLSVLGVALGVAVVVAVDLAGSSAERAFSLSMESLLGRTTHHIIGGPAGFDEAVYRRLRIDRGVRTSAPVVEGFAELDGETLRVLGVDPLAERGFRQRLAGQGGIPVRALMAEPDTVLLSEANARHPGLAPGDRTVLVVGGEAREVKVAGLLAPETGPPAVDLILTDIATAQELLGRLGRLDRIDLILTDDEARTLRRWLPEGLRLVDAARRAETTEQLTRAFRVNLTAMSLLALVVGGFLIYNTMTFSVLRRRTLLGMLRVLGVTRAETGRLVIGEALMLGLVGTVIGLAGGWALGLGLVRLVTRTINDLYFVLNVTSLNPDPLSFAAGTALGLCTTAVAAALPARTAARTAPGTVQRRSYLESGAAARLPLLTGLGLALIAAAFVLAYWPARALLPGFGALFLLLVGTGLLVPAMVLFTARWASPVLAVLLGPLGRLAARGVAGSLSRSGMAIAALTIAVAATIGMGVMVDSFRETVRVWLTQTLQSDLYVSAPGTASSRADGTLPAELAGRLRALPEIDRVSTGRRVEVESPLGPVPLTALDPAPRSLGGYLLKSGDPTTLWPRFLRGERVLVSEPFAYRYRKGVGDTVELLTASGERAFTIGGVFFDYESDRGRVVMVRSLYDRYWDDPAISSLGLYVADGTTREAAMRAVRAALADSPRQFRIRSNREIRERSLQIFDQTFEVTRVLRLLAIGVAFIGVLSALMALQLERAREHAVLRATGVTPGGLLAMVSAQTGLMGLIAGVLAVPLGLAVAQILTDVINKRSFGWSMQMLVSPSVLIEGIAVAVIAALVAGLYPAWRMARVPPADALREE